jgi:hypothetical protein
MALPKLAICSLQKRKYVMTFYPVVYKYKALRVVNTRNFPHYSLWKHNRSRQIGNSLIINYSGNPKYFIRNHWNYKGFQHQIYAKWAKIFTKVDMYIKHIGRQMNLRIKKNQTYKLRRSFSLLKHVFFNLQQQINKNYVVDYVDGVRLCLWTAATNVPAVHLPADIWVWRATVEWYWQGKAEELWANPVAVQVYPP